MKRFLKLKHHLKMNVLIFLNKIKKEVNCDIMIIGSYISKKVPDFVNEIRKNTQNILKEFCSINNWTYFDLSTTISMYNNIEKDATHFNQKGIEILSEKMYSFIIKKIC